MAVKAGERALSTAAIIKGIAFAEQNGAKIVNASWGGSAGSCAAAYDEALYRAIQGFSGLFVTSAGNDAANHDGSSYFGIPADYGQTTSCWAGLDNIISVAAANADDGLASFSDFGSDFIDVAAPGVDIYSTVASSMPLNENFEGTTVPNIPAGWAREGSGNNWRTASVSGSNALYGDLSFPYADNATSSVISPVYDLSSTTEATIEFSVSCDTEYDPVYWTDYLSLLLSSDGVNFNEEYKFDEFWIDLLNEEDPFSSSSAASMHFYYALPSEYLTSNFKAGFGWTSDGDDNNHDGCRIDDLKIVKMPDPADGTGAGYDYMSGTSMATPHAAGLAALVWGYNPNWTSAQVKNVVINTGDSPGSLSGKTTTGKRINAYNALNAFNPVIGYDSGNVIPTSSISHTGSLGGRYVSFKVKDGAAGRPVYLSDFGYSLDGGANWKTPANGDDSAAFSGNWRTNDAVSEEAYLTGLDYSGRAYSFSFNTQHADFSDFNDADTDNVMIRFKASDEARISGYVLSGPFSIDNILPAALVITQPAAATRINADSYSIIGAAEPEAAIAITKNGLPVSSTTIPATTSDFSITVPLGQNSTNTFGVTATDSGGNSLKIVYLPPIIEDSGKAALSLLSVGGDLAAPYYTASSTPEIIFNATDISPDLVCRRGAVDAGYSAMPAENEFSVSADASSSSFVLPDQGEDGLKAVYISCRDMVGNENSADDNLDANFVLDTVAPAAVLSSLPSSGTAAKTADIVVGGEGVSFYKYKLDSGSYSSSLGIASHISLSGLSVGSHILSVVGGDEAGNWQAAASSTDYDWTIISGSSGSYGGGGGGGGASDVTAPAISNIVATPTGQTTATITWQTNESSLSWVLYGTSTVYGQQVKTTSYTSSHSVALTGLTAGTVYHYQVRSQDSYGNAGAAPDKTFTTLVAGQTGSSTSTGSGTGTGSSGTGTGTGSSGSATTTKPVSEMTREEMIAFILQLIAAMQTGGTGGSGSSLSGIPSNFTFQNNLKFGMTMIDVKYLQIVLNSSADTRVALTGAGSPGYETSKFGNATLAAVKKFQAKYGIAPVAGFVGTITRAKLNSLLGR
jgi:subtilisin family serine protease